MEEKDAGQAEHLTLNQENVRCYVGVGASAGGVEALQELFQHMPPDTGASFIIVVLSSSIPSVLWMGKQ